MATVHANVNVNNAGTVTMPQPRRRSVEARRHVVSRRAQPVRSAQTANAPQIASLLLDDGTVRRILLNESLVSEIPFLRPYAEALRQQVAKKTKASCCGGGGVAATSGGGTEYNAVRFGIVNLPEEKKAKIKQALNVRSLRVYYLDGSSHKMRATV